MLDSALDYLNSHQEYALLFIFLISLFESLLVVGVIVPGVALLSAIAITAGQISIPLWQVLICAWLGAVMGDAISYGCGYVFRHRIHDVWPFKLHPDWLNQGHAFFNRHGGKSVFFGRFIGPIRPFIPVVAGMMDMKPNRFLFWNLISASAWAPLYLIPPYVLGDTLNIKDWLNWKGVIVMSVFTVIALIVTWLLKKQNQTTPS